MKLENLKYYYINLKDSVDRKKNMEQICSKLNVNYERFDAIKITDEKPFLETQTIGKVSIWNSNAGSRVGAFGCFLSHFTLIEKHRNDDEPFVILEDDISPESLNNDWLSEFSKKINKLLSLTNNNVTLVRPITHGSKIQNCASHSISDKEHHYYTSKGFEYNADFFSDKIYDKQFLKCPIQFKNKKLVSNLKSPFKKSCSSCPEPTIKVPGLATPFCYIHNPKKIYNSLLNFVHNTKQKYTFNFITLDRVYTGFLQNSYIVNSQEIRRLDIQSDIKRQNNI